VDPRITLAGGTLDHGVQGLMILAVWAGTLAAVLCLLKACRPSAVAWLVVAVVVGAVKRVGWRRTLAHVCEEVRELLPTWMDLDSALGVRAFWGATVPHVRPSGVCWSETTVERVAVRRAGRFVPISTKATAGSGLAEAEVGSARNGNSAAVALTAVAVVAPVLIVVSNNDESVEAFTNHRDLCHA